MNLVVAFVAGYVTNTVRRAFSAAWAKTSPENIGRVIDGGPNV